jgi:alpha-tubulin suppressor-like RCC1 family protein
VRRHRAFVFASLSSAAFAGLLVVACSDAPEERTSFDEQDANRPPNLPPNADGSVDAAPAIDARPPFDPKEEAVTCTATPCVKELVAGDNHFCALIEGGTVKCWGEDRTPADVEGLTGVTQISAGGRTTCAIGTMAAAGGPDAGDAGATPTTTGVHCWGGNAMGELGLSIDPPTFDLDPHPSPTPVALADLALGAIARVDVGHGSACATATNGKVACWGRDHREQLANRPYDEFELDPYRGPAIAKIDPLAPMRTLIGGTTGYGLTANGEVWTWGAVAGNEGTASGRVSSVSPDQRPVRVMGLSDVKSLAVSGLVFPPEPEPIPDIPTPPPPPPRAHACALAGNGGVYCWGRSYTGALCTGLPDQEQTPRAAPISSKYWPQQVAVADEITCARMTDGTVQCCGADTKGKLGTGTVGIYSPSFVPATGFKGYAVRVATSVDAVCALVQGGTVECWGSNEKNQLGQTKADDAPHATPLKVVF